MGKILRLLGIAILVATAWLLLADAAGWIPSGLADRWAWTGAKAGAGVFGAGLLFGAMGPLANWLRKGRCVRCGASTPRGQAYCRDHLQETVNEYRDQARERMYENAHRR